MIIDILKYLFFQLLFVLAPSVRIGSMLFSGKMPAIAKMLSGYPVTLCLLFILNILGKKIGVPYLEIFVPLFFLGGHSMKSMLNMFSKEQHEMFTKKHHYLFLLTFITVSLAFLLSCTIPNAGIFSTGAVPDPDLYFNIGNTWSYIHDGLPLKSIRLEGNFVGPYHLFQNIFFAGIYNFTSVQPQDILLFIEPYFTLLILVAGLIYLPAVYNPRYNPLTGVLICIALFFTSHAASYYTLLGHNLISQVSFFVSLLPFIHLVLYFYYTELDRINVIYVAALFMLCAANKAILIPMAGALIALYIAAENMRARRHLKTTVLLAGASAAVALFLFFTIYAGAASPRYSPGEGTSPDPVSVARAFVRTISYYLADRTASCLIIIPVIFIIIQFKNLREMIRQRQSFFIACAGFALLSFLLPPVFNFGVNNMYFFFYLDVLMMCITAFAALYLFRAKRTWITAMVIVAVIPSVLNAGALYRMKMNACSGSDPGLRISRNELDAARWMKNNIPQDKIFAHDFKGHFTEEAPFNTDFIFWSSFSGKTCYLDGYAADYNAATIPLVHHRLGILRELYTSADSSFIASARAEHINYYLQHIKPGTKPAINMQPAFENEAVRIYQLK